MTSHYSDDGQKLYDPKEMRKFTEKFAPGLFERVLEIISANNSREQLQQQRAVALLHQMSFFKNQVFILSL